MKAENELLQDWKSAHIGDIVDPARPVTYGVVQPGERQSVGIPLIRGKDYSSGEVNTSDLYQIDPSIAYAYRRSVVKGGDILLSIVGYVGQSAMVPPELSGANITQTTARIAIGRGYSKRFFLHQFRSSFFQMEVRRFMKGSAQPGLNLADVEKMQVIIPPLHEQEKIADILDTADEVIRSTKRVIAKFQKMRDGLAADIFPALRALRGTSVAPNGSLFLKDVGRWLSGGTPNTVNPMYWNGNTSWISAASLKNFNIIDSDRKVTEEGALNGTRIVPSGTVIFVVRGMSLKSEFRVGVTGRRVAFGQDCKAIIPAQGIDPLFLAHTLRAGEHQILQLVDEAGHGTGRLETKQVQQLTMQVPALREQQRLVSIISSADHEAARLTDELGKLDVLKQGLMDDLLSKRTRVEALT